MNVPLWLNQLVEMLEPTATRIALTILHSLWQGVVAASMLAVVARVWRRRPASSRYAASTLALFSLPLMAAATFMLIEVDLATSTVSPSQLVETESIPTLSAPPSESLLMTPANTPEAVGLELTTDTVASPLIVASEAADRPAQLTTERSLATIVGWLDAASPWVAVLYSLGVTLMLLRTATSLWRGSALRRSSRLCDDPDLLAQMQRLARRLGLPRTPSVAFCERLAAPAVCGLFKPIVLLPPALLTNLTADELAAILTHELAHIRRHDMIVNLLQRVVESLMFYHPAAWWISRQVSVERENCCDDLATASGVDNLQYVAALLRVAELCLPARRADLAATAALSIDGGKPSLLSRRIERLLGIQTTTRASGSRMLSIALAIIAFSTAGGLGVWAQQRNPSSPPQPVANARDEQRSGNEAESSTARQATAEPATAPDVDAPFVWGDAVDGLRLGVRPATKLRRAGEIRHGDLLSYEVWIKNESDKTIHIPRSPVEYRVMSHRQRRINVIGSSVIMSFAVPVEAFDKATLTVPPGEARNLVLRGEVAELVRSPEAKPSPNQRAPLRLETGEHTVYAEGQLFYHTGSEPNPPQPKSQQVRLKSGEVKVAVKPAARLQLRELTEVNDSALLDALANDPAMRIMDWKPEGKESTKVVLADSRPVLLDQDDIVAVHSFNRIDPARSAIRVSLTPSAATSFASSTEWLSREREDPLLLGVLLDGELLSVRKLESSIRDPFPVIPTSFSAAGAERFSKFLAESMFHCPCQTAWSDEVARLRVGARLSRDPTSDRIVVEFSLKNSSRQSIDVGVGPSRERATIESYKQVTLDPLVVDLGNELPAGRYRVTPSLKEVAPGEYHVEAMISLLRNSSLIAEHQVTTPTSVLILDGDDPEVESSGTPEPDSTPAKREAKINAVLAAQLKDVADVRVTTEVKRAANKTWEAKIRVRLPTTHLEATWRKNHPGEWDKGKRPTGESLEQMRGERIRALQRDLLQALQEGNVADGPTTLTVDFYPSGPSRGRRFDERLNVRDVAFSADGRLLTSVATEKKATIRTWDVKTGALTREVELESELHGNQFLMAALELTADGKRLITIIRGEVHVWDASTGKLIAKFKQPEDARGLGNRVLATTASGDRIAAATAIGLSGFPRNYDLEILLWSSPGGKLEQRFVHRDAVQVTSLAISAEGDLLASGSQTGKTSVFDTESGELLFAITNTNPEQRHPDKKVSEDGANQVLSLAFSPNGELLAVGDMLGVKLYSTKTKQRLALLPSPFRFGRCDLVFSADGRFIARVGTDKLSTIWSTESHRVVARLENEAHAGAFTRDGRLFATGFTDRESALLIWNLTSDFGSRPRDGVRAAPSEALRFLTPYPDLYGLRLGMKADEVGRLLEAKELPYEVTSNLGRATISIDVGDGHVIVVMFNSLQGGCVGIQRLRGP